MRIDREMSASPAVQRSRLAFREGLAIGWRTWSFATARSSMARARASPTSPTWPSRTVRATFLRAVPARSHRPAVHLLTPPLCRRQDLRRRPQPRRHGRGGGGRHGHARDPGFRRHPLTLCARQPPFCCSAVRGEPLIRGLVDAGRAVHVGPAALAARRGGRHHRHRRQLVRRQ